MRLERRFSYSFMGVLGVFKASLQPDQLQVCWSFTWTFYLGFAAEIFAHALDRRVDAR